MEYDVYYTTGGGPWVNAGSDTWVNLWLELIAPKLKVKPILLIHRNKPKGHEDFEFPIETYWHGDNIEKFEELCKNARRINILHGHYTPMKCIVDNKDKIHSNVMHNSVDHIIKAQIGGDSKFNWHPYLDSKWESDVNDWAKHSIWVGLFDILYDAERIPNFYEFKQLMHLSQSTKLGFASRCEGRKNPHYLDGMEALLFTNSVEFKAIWKDKIKIDSRKIKIYNYDGEFKKSFYKKDWGISHSAFVSEPFGYSIFEAVDYGKLPILHKTWCPEFEYPYRVSSKRQFKDIYNIIVESPYSEKIVWFNKLKNFMIKNFTNKEEWVARLLEIYNN